MRATAATSGLFVVFFVLPVVPTQDASVTCTEQICASKGSTVEIRCKYSYPLKIGDKNINLWRRWFSKESKAVTESDHVWLCCKARDECSLTIRDLSESDSGKYTLHIKTSHKSYRDINGSGKLTVTDVKVQVTKMEVHQFYTEAELRCLSSCGPGDPPAYVWFKNGQKIQNETYAGRFYPGDNISCALNGHEAFGSAAMYAPDVPKVRMTPAGEITEGHSVTLTCNGNLMIEPTYTWYKKDVNEEIQTLRNKQGIVLTSVDASDSGEYYCTCENELGRSTSRSVFIDVKYAPKLPSVAVSPPGTLVEGNSVMLTCSSDANPAANYTWYKENQTLHQGAEGSYNFTPISSEHRGNYSCRSENDLGALVSTTLFLDVQYTPKILSVSMSASGELVEGISVNLTCSSDANPAANYTWYKENENSPVAMGRIFSISDFTAELSGYYYCEAQNTRGCDRFPVRLALVTGEWKLIVAVTVAAVVLVILIAASVWISLKTRKKNNSKPPSGPNNGEQTPPAEREKEIKYSSIYFSKKEADPHYSNISAAQQHGLKDENSVHYASIKINNGAASLRGQETVETSAVKSTVNQDHAKQKP